MNEFDQILEFKGNWRAYQKRVLNKSLKHLQDNKFHVVAAPGSGKTTLGIELIKMVGNNTLVLVPSIAIREQWVNRISNSFMSVDLNIEDYVSTSLSKMKSITIVTYQAVHSAYLQFQGEIVNDEFDKEERIDFSTFNLLQALNDNKVKTICLDEAHHLRKEWWNTLEDVVKSLPCNYVTISLTATPPYDSTLQEWERYTSLCGEIDEEIFTPELVQEGSLCPHQDYIYFTHPTRSERKMINEQKQNIKKVVQLFLDDESFKKSIQTHVGLNDLENYEFLENPKYFTSFLILMNKLNIKYPKYLDKLIGKKINLPDFNYSNFETFLQGFLYDDNASFQIPKENYNHYIKQLKEANCLIRNKVVLNVDEIYAKQLTSSVSKLTSINNIVEAEYDNLGQSLRLLVLCDYIKKEQKALISTDDIILQIGAIPIFESLRRNVSNDIKIAVLSGSVVILPVDCIDFLKQQIPESNIKICKLPISDYVEITINGMNHRCVEIVTKLFEQGYFQVLIGTKSLLGEGWDSPCINSMILATFVGSFMLSNQMRGRAIRKDPNNNNKVSNIWHLVCTQYPSNDFLSSTDGISEDFKNLQRRFKTYLGLHYQLNQIESGCDRITTIKLPFNEDNLEKMNKDTLKLANNRLGLQEKWKQTLKTVDTNFEINDVIGLKRKSLLTSFTFLNILTFLSIVSFYNIIIYVLIRGLTIFSTKAQAIQILIVVLLFVVLNWLFNYTFWHIYKRLSQKNRFKKLADALHMLLIDINLIGSQSRVYVNESDSLEIDIRLENASIKEQTIFIECIKDMFAEIDNQRYFIMQSLLASNYFAVPEMFSKRREDALLFIKYINKAIGRYKLIYSRNPQGRKLLLKARKNSYINKNKRILHNEKKAKSKFE